MITPPRYIAGAPFVRGPIPLDWLVVAARLGGKALHVGLYCWYLAGLNDSVEVKLSTGKLQTFGVSRQAVHRALAALERQRLLFVDRRPGCCPVITLLVSRGEIGSALEYQPSTCHVS
jgi:hypothetical protein